MSANDSENDVRLLQVHVKTRWEGGIKTTTLIRGFEVESDSPKWKYGTNTAPAPGEIFLASIGACFTSTFTRCSQESGTELGAVNTDVRGSMKHERSGRESLDKITMELKVHADARYEAELRKCFERSKSTCPLTNVVKCETEITYKFVSE